jgi:hypothetical protein
MYVKFVVIGRIIEETETHYITEDTSGRHTWSKQWYRPMVECS